MSAQPLTEDDLLSHWPTRDLDFNRDGIVDPAGYDQAPVKLLFLMKEPYAPVEPDRDLRRFLRDGAHADTWDDVTRWVEGIFAWALHGRIPEWKELAKIDVGQRKAALRQVCVVNLKKSASHEPTDGRKWRPVVSEDASRLRDQLGLYSPDLTICCGSLVTNAVRQHKLIEAGDPDQETLRGIRYWNTATHGTLIDYAHPAARVAPQLLLYGLLDAIAEIRPRHPT